MNVSECKHKIKCDFGGCKKVAKFCFSRNGEMPFNLCEDCAKEFSETVKKVFVPKSVKAPFKNMKKIRSDEK